MKRLILVLLVLSISFSAFSQTKMFINKTNGTDSLWLSDVRSIYFKTYSSSPTLGLIAWYPFNGNTKDSSGNGNNSSNYGATFTTDRFGNASNACVFNGNGNYIQLPDNMYTDSIAELSFSAWSYSTNSSISNRKILSMFRQMGELHLNVINNYCLFSVANQGNADGGQMLLNQWIHWVCLYKRGQYLKIYINNILKDSVSILAQNLNPYGDYISAIGSYRGYQEYWDGKIDDIRIYKRALSTSEIYQLYHEGGW